MNQILRRRPQEQWHHQRLNPMRILPPTEAEEITENRNLPVSEEVPKDPKK